MRRTIRAIGVSAVLAIAMPLAVGGAEPAKSSSTSSAPAQTGEQVYARWCVHCHDAGRGNPGTQSLQVKYRGSVPAVLLERTDLTSDAVAVFVRQGVLSMPPFRKTEITDAELALLADYVSRANKR